MAAISTEPYDPFEDNSEDLIPEKPVSRCYLLARRVLAFLLVVSFIFLAFSGVLRLFGLPSLNFLIESRALTRDPAVKAMIQAIVTVDADNRRGTGFNIDPRGLVVTNNHVVEGADRVRISFTAGKTLDIDEWIQAPDVDLAIIALDLADQDLPVLELAVDTLPTKGDEVIVIGNPLGFFRVANRAVVLGYTALTDWDIPVLMIKGPVYKGNSGSPVINADGRVVGVIFATADQPDAKEIIAFAIPISAIEAVIAQDQR